MKNYIYYPQLLPKDIASKTLKYLHTEVPWRQITYYSNKAKKIILTPRETYVYGFHQENRKQLLLDPHKTSINIKPVPQELRPIYLWVSKYFNEYFNFMLLAKYSKPEHSISFHSDDESFLIKDSSIISVTLSEPSVYRKFIMKNIKTKEKDEYLLGNQDVFKMSYETQRTHYHGIPKQKQINGIRYGITFRNGNANAFKNYYRYN